MPELLSYIQQSTFFHIADKVVHRMSDLCVPTYDALGEFGGDFAHFLVDDFIKIQAILPAHY